MAGRGLAKRTIALIEACAAILEEIQPTSVRGVCYQLFVRGRQIPNMSIRETKRISGVLTKAREHGVIPWEWVVDETRQVEQRQTWSTPSQYADTVMQAYSKDWWAEHPEHLMVISKCSKR
jgi:hypothetical protein